MKKKPSINFRGLSQEALARLRRGFDVEATLETGRDQRWVDAAFASGPESPLTRAELDKVRARVLPEKS